MAELFAFLRWIFEDFWRWLGLVILVLAIAEGIGPFLRTVRR